MLNLADEIVLAYDHHLGPVETHLHEAMNPQNPRRLTVSSKRTHGSIRPNTSSILGFRLKSLSVVEPTEVTALGD